MFKSIGMIFVFFSVFCAFMRRTTVWYSSYIFLKQTEYVFRYLLYRNLSLSTYPEIFAELNSDKLYLYKDFIFSDRDNFFKNFRYKSLMDSYRLNMVKDKFFYLGYRKTADEKAYIENSVAELHLLSETYKEKYIKNYKSDRLCGLSISVIIIVLII